jgi:linoleate 9S-lipoxygenase
MFQNIIDAITGDSDGSKKLKCGDGECKKIKGTVVLMKKNVLGFNDFHASVLDRVHELLGQRVSLQLISAVNSDRSGE